MPDFFNATIQILIDRNAGRLVNDYMDYLAGNFPSWVPVQPLSKLTTNQIEQIEARLDMIKNEYAKDHLPAMYGLVGGRRAIPINEDFVKECNLAFEPSFIMPDGNRTECVTLGMWPADTGGQYWQFKKTKPQKSQFFKNRYTTIAADETTIYQMMFPDYPDIVTTAQLREMLGISRRLACQLINDGSIPGILIGNTYKIPKANIISFVMDQKQRETRN